MDSVGAFQPTLWSVVVRAADASDPHRRTALSRLCEIYWKPVYAYLRRKGRPPERAEDETQGFFAHLLEKDLLGNVRRDCGRFRGFLLAVLEHYLANEHRIAVAEKRGGGRPPLSLDGAESGFEPAGGGTPEEEFHRAWALSVLEQAFDALRRDFDARGLPGHFDAVRSFLSAEADRPTYQELADRLGCSQADVTNLLHRSRKKLRELIRAVLRETVDGDPQLDAELHDLFQLL